MIPREAQSILEELANAFPVVTVTGPRQSGKTTLVKNVFPDMKYNSLEDPGTREFAETDPIGFLAQYPQGVILDEIQRVPQLLSYIQTIVDEKQSNGYYILTGSNQFEYLKAINQSLAGRTGILRLLPFSYREIYQNRNVDLDELLYKGFYPRIFDQDIRPDLFYSAYLATYLERDLRNINNIHNLSLFRNFMQLCAGRTGQLLNKNGLANECGISNKRVEEWLSTLEASYILYRLKPYYKNWNKRISKSPKLYFYDTGLVSHLLKIENREHIQSHPLRGEIFENFVITECLKRQFHRGKRDNFYYYRDNNRNEVDIMIDTHFGPVPVEIKSGQTINKNFFKGLNYFSEFNNRYQRSGLIIGRPLQETRSAYFIHGYSSVYTLLDELTGSDNCIT